MTWNVYVNGDIEMMAGAYNGVAMLFNDSSNLTWAAACFALLALLWGAAKKTMNDKDSVVTNLFLGMVLFTFLVAKDDVVLESSRTGQVITVDNVPLMVAATGGISTSIFSTVIDNMRTAFTAVNPYDLSGVTDASGGLDPLRAIVTASQLSYQGGNLCRPNGSNIDYCAYIKNYSADCIARDISTGGPAQETSFSKLMHSTPAELLTIMKVSVATWTVTRPKTSVSVPDVVSCDVAYQEISSYINGQAFETSMQNFAAAHGISDEAMQSGMNMLMASNLSAFDLNKARFLQTQIIAGLPKGGAVAGPQVAADLSQFQAQEARLAQMGSQYKLYNQLAPAMITAFEFFAIFVAPLVLILSVTGRAGISILVNYLGLVFTLNVWPLASVLVDSFMRYSILRDMNAMNIDMGDRAASLSWSSLPDTIDAIQTYLAVGSSLTALAPMMFFALFKVGSGSVMSGGNRQLAPQAPVDTGYVAPTIATAGNAGATRAGQITATADLAHQGNQVVSSTAGPLAGEMTTGSMTTAALGKQIQAMESQMATESASIGRSVMNNLTSGLQNSTTTGVSSKESAMDNEARQAALAATEAYSKQHNVGTEEAAAILSSASRDERASIMAGLKLNFAALGGGGNWTGTASDTDTSSAARQTREGNSVGTSGGLESRSGMSVSALAQRGFELAQGAQATTTSGQSSGASDLRQQIEQFAQQRSHLNQLNESLTSQSNMGVGAKDDIAGIAQRAEGFSMDRALSDVSGQHKEALVKAGLLSSDGGLSNGARQSFEGTIASVGNAAQGGIDHGALERVAGAKTLISGIQEMFKSGDASQVAAGTALVNSMIGQGYDTAAMRELSKVGSEIVAANNGEQANAQWGATGGDITPQLGSNKGAIESQTSSLQAGVASQAANVGGQLDAAPQNLENRKAENNAQVDNKNTDNSAAVAPAAVQQGQSAATLQGITGSPVPEFGPKKTESDAWVQSSPTTSALARGTQRTAEGSAAVAAEAKYDTNTGVTGMTTAKEREFVQQAEADKAARVASPQHQQTQALTQPGEKEKALVERQQQLQERVDNGSATTAERSQLARTGAELQRMQSIRLNFTEQANRNEQHFEMPLQESKGNLTKVDENKEGQQADILNRMNKS